METLWKMAKGNELLSIIEYVTKIRYIFRVLPSTASAVGPGVSIPIIR